MRSILNPDGAPAAVLVLSLTAAACSGPSEPPPKSSSPPIPSAIVAAPPPELVPSAKPPEANASEKPPPDKKAEQVCPDDMVYVDTTYCPDPELECVKKEHNKPNKIIICHEFPEGEQKCKTETRRQRFCIDRYEYPNKEGGHPPVMVDWYDALNLCQEQGKRLCWESEWVAACEGPKKTPFPYGFKRDPKMCNIDNGWLNVDLKKVYSKDPTISEPELFRLDQSVSSGEMPGCTSGFGVHDQTGNVDEWVNAEATYPKSKWAGLKGGAWGHVRNACRPMTVSHEPEFTYYFVSFRCCADPTADPEAEKDAKFWKPPPQPNPKKPGAFSRGFTPKTRGPHQPTPPKG